MGVGGQGNARAARVIVSVPSSKAAGLLNWS